MSALVSHILKCYFVQKGGRGDVSSIFIYVSAVPSTQEELVYPLQWALRRHFSVVSLSYVNIWLRPRQDVQGSQGDIRFSKYIITQECNKCLISLYGHITDTGTASADRTGITGWCHDCLWAQRIKHSIMLASPLQRHIRESFEE